MRFYVISCIILGLSAAARADIGPTPGTQRVQPIFAQSDVVCNCSITSVAVAEEREVRRNDRPLAWRRMIAKARVEDLYKGTVAEGSTILIEYEDEKPTTRALPVVLAGSRGLLFLKIGPSLSYTFSDAFIGVTWFTSFPFQQGSSGLVKLEAALANVLGASNHTDTIAALRILQGFDQLGSSTLDKVEPLSNSNDPAVALGAIAVLLKTKSAMSVDQLRGYLSRYNDTAEPVALVSIGSELGQIDDERALASIESLADSRYLTIRLGAMHALRRMKSEASATVLVHKLDDPDSIIQYIAVMTLAEIFKKQGEYAPSLRSFDQKPLDYVNLWKAWALEKQLAPE